MTSTSTDELAIPKTEIKPEVSFYSPPEFGSTPPTSIEYRLRPLEAAKDQRGWNVNHRKESTFISFGREPPVDLPVSHDSVSRKHAVLQYGNGDSGPGWYLYDLGSSHGTYLNNDKIPVKEYVFVEDNVPIRLGFANKFQFTLVSNHVIENDDIEKKTVYDPPNWRLKVPEELNYSLEVINNGSVERTIPLKELLFDDNYITIGSKPETAKIVDRNPSISRLHAVLQFGKLGKKYGWFIYDNASTHGTKLNRARLQQRYYAKLPIGGSFVLGGSKKLYVLTGVEIENEEEYAKKAFGTTDSSGNKAQKPDESKEYEIDPIGWLTSHFESEGMQVEYSFVPSGETTICSIDLGGILQTSSEETETVARGEGKGRDEAKRNAALIACKMIDMQDDNQKTSEFRTKRQEYEQNDYYSSDEDEFLDRTGSLEAKRKLRKARYEDKKEPEVLNYDNLVKLLEEARQHLESVQNSHNRIMKESGSSKSLSNKFYVSASRQRLTKAQAEVARLEPLVAATKPMNIDHMFEKKDVNKSDNKLIDDENVCRQQMSEEKNLLKEQDTTVESEFKVPELPMKSKVLQKRPAAVVVEDVPDISSNAGDVADKASEIIKIEEELQKKAIPEGYGLIHRKDLQALKNKELLAKKRKIQEDEEDYFNRQDPKEIRDMNEEIRAPEDEAVWLPPEDQTGSGMTKLNEKFAGRY